jgi:signal transduction histidine kinase
LLENIAQQSGAAVYAAQLTGHLQKSRLQLITSREEERRRIHRDLHDGLGPQLATLSVKLDAARNYLSVDPAASDQLLRELKGQVQDAIQDVRRLVYDLRPQRSTSSAWLQPCGNMLPNKTQMGCRLL